MLKTHPPNQKKLNGRIAIKRNTVKLRQIKSKSQVKCEQKCNYYLSRLQRVSLEETYDGFESLQAAKNYYPNRLDIYSAELDLIQEDLLYLPHRIVKINTISDIIYYEGLYGKEIYKKENYKAKVSN